MRALPILFFTIFLLSLIEIKAQIEIYDGRNASANTKISEQEKHLIENFVRKNEKRIKEFGKSSDFQCEQDFFLVDSVAQGFFTRKNLRQKAYLYQLCFSGKAQYAISLGGIVIVENNKPTGHYPFANISGYNHLKALPDINRNGYSEIVVEFSHSINSLNFAKAIRIFDLAPSGLMEVATLETFSRLGENDVAYKIYGKIGQSPLFSREIYESETQTDKWILRETLKSFATGAPVYSSNNLSILPIYDEFSAPALPAREISRRVLKLIKNLRVNKDISPPNIEKITGIKMEPDSEDRKSYGGSGKVADSNWIYFFHSSVTLYDNQLHFEFRNMDGKDDDLSPVCAVDFETFKKELESIGFTAVPKKGEHGRHLGWDFKTTSGIFINILDYWQNEKLKRNCVKSLRIYI